MATYYQQKYKQGGIALYTKSCGVLEFPIQIASSLSQQMIGYIGRKNGLADNEAMLFIIQTNHNLRLVMTEIPIPLDLLWIKDDKIKRINHNLQPYDSRVWTCKNTTHVLELRGGLCKEKNIKVGDTMKVVHQFKSNAKKRILRDLREWKLYENELNYISAEPLENNIFIWHCNMHFSFHNIVFHFIIKLPDNYPYNPPRIYICTKLKHSNVSKSTEGYSICLDMLESSTRNIPYHGWTCAYSIFSVLFQLQSFLCDVENQKKYTKKDIDLMLKQSQSFKCKECGHSAAKPFPSIKSGSKSNIKPKENKQSEQSDTLQTNINKTSSVGENIWYDMLYLVIEEKIISFLAVSELFVFSRVSKHFKDLVNNTNSIQMHRFSCWYHRIDLRSAKLLSNQKNSRKYVINKKKKINILDGYDMNVLNKFVLGYGIEPKFYGNVDRNNKLNFNRLQSCETTFDLLSYDAFDNWDVRTTVWKEKTFSHYIPIYINKKHGAKSLKILEKCCVAIFGKHKSFEPFMAVHLICTIMNSLVVKMMNIMDENNTLLHYHSINILDSYFYYYHLLLSIYFKYHKKLHTKIQSLCDNFINDEEYRHKKYVPNMGEFLLYFTLTSYKWKQICAAILDESFVRNQKWIFQKYGDLEIIKTKIDDKIMSNRIDKSWKATSVSRKLLMFQYFFLKNVCKIGIYSPQQNFKQLNENYGCSPEYIPKLLQQFIKNIEKIDNFTNFFKTLEMSGIPSKKQLFKLLQDSVKKSKNKNYHGHRSHDRSYTNKRSVKPSRKKYNKNKKKSIQRRVTPDAPPINRFNFGAQAKNYTEEITDGEVIELQGTLEGHSNWITCIKCDMNNPNAIITSSRDKSIILWKLDRKQLGQTTRKIDGKMVRKFTGHNHFISDIDISADSNYILSGSWDGLLRLWNMKTGQTVRKFVGHKKDVLAVQFSCDNRRIISSGMDKIIFLWNTIGEIKQQIPTAHRNWITCIAFSANTAVNIFVSASYDKIIKVWEYDNELGYKLKFELIGHKHCITSIAISPDGSLCATGDKYGELNLWDIEQGKLLSTLSTSNAGLQINCLIFSPNRYWVCIACGNCIEIIDLESKSSVCILRLARDQENTSTNQKHYSTLRICTCIAWSYDGKTLFSGYSDNKIRVWSLISSNTE